MTSKAELQRITLVTETFAPEINGVANTLGHLVNGMLASGVQVQLIRPRQTQDKNAHGDAEANSLRPDAQSADSQTFDSQTSDTPATGLQTLALPGLPLPGYQGLRFGLPARRRISKALAEFQPQAVYVATEGPMGLSAIKASRQQNIPVASGFHTNFHQYIEHYHLGALENLAYRYLRYVHNLTCATLVPTQQQAAQLREHQFANVKVLSRGVDSRLFHPDKRSENLRQQWHTNHDDLVLIYVGRIAAEKNLQLALNCYQQLKSNDERVKLVLVGDGPELTNIRQHYPQVICAGMQTGEALAQYYASGDVFLFPSKTDTFGNVVTEAMASGLALISFDYAAGLEYLRHGDNGMLASFDHEDEFIRHAQTLLDSPNLLRQLRRRARLSAEQINWHSIVDEFLSLHQQAQQQKSYAGTQAIAEHSNNKRQNKSKNKATKKSSSTAAV